MIATIAAIAETKKLQQSQRSHETTLQRSQRQQSLRYKVLSQRSLSLRSLGSGFHMIAELFFLSDRRDHSGRSHHMETGLNLSQ